MSIIQYVTERANDFLGTVVIRDDIEALEAEVTKIDRLEFVVAVVGTMKAGKSTAINAIVGTDVLPSRNLPMTTLPTLIRHTPGTSNPVLVVEKRQPLDQLVARLRANPGVPELRDDGELGDTVDAVESENTIKPRYVGTEQIRDCLRTLNDLVRLSTEVGEGFPFEDYDEIQDLPVIEVEFAHLEETAGSSAGSLVLLDTPGPNEADQPHLRKMLRDQLANASAVMLVLDYTQLKSQADADVRAEVERIASISSTRMHALVNKFDQKDRHGAESEDLKTLVVEDLMQSEDRDLVGADSVFPVSAKWAYLAKRAQHALSTHGCLPDATTEQWVEDFGEAAFGRLWEQKVRDRDAVAECARELWEDSLFDKPLDRVIGEAHSETVVRILQSATDKLAKYTDRMMNFTNIRKALDKDIEELDEHITTLKKDQQDLANSERKARQQFNVHLDQAFTEMTAKADETKRTAKEELERRFELGRLKEERVVEKRRRNQTERQGFLSEMLEPIFSRLEAGLEDRKWDPKRQVVTFYDRDEARRLVKAMDKSVRDVMKSSNKSVRQAIDSVFSGTKDDLARVTKELNESLAKLDSKMKERGFELRLRTPETTMKRLPNFARNIMNQALEEEEYDVEYRRHKSTVWGRVCSWLGTSEWGTEEYTEKEERFVIDLRKARAAMDRGVDDTYGKLNEHVKKHVEDTIGRATTDLYADAQRVVERIRGDLIRSRRQAGLEAKEKQELAKQLAVFESRGRDIGTDCEGLRQDIGGLA